VKQCIKLFFLNYFTMEAIQIQDKNIIRITDILEQIKALNKMIDLYKSDEGSSSMLSQYDYMKREFVEELKPLLKGFQITIDAA